MPNETETPAMQSVYPTQSGDGNMPSESVLGSEPSNPRKALIVEDIREAERELKERGYSCDRITHNELLSSDGTEYTGKLLKGDYSMLWISTPSDWHVRTSKATPHWQRIKQWIQKAIILGIMLVLFGSPGFLWKLPNIQETIQESNMTSVRMRLCHFGDKFNRSEQQPSGSYLQVATNAKISPKKWQCQCKIPIQEHALDWYGREPERTIWRKKVTSKLIKELCNALELHNILDVMTSPSSIPTLLQVQAELLPTDSRLKQKERLTKLKEAGLKPVKKIKHTEPGNDDCGDDISGLGPDAVLLGYDAITELISSSDEEDLFIAIPRSIRDGQTGFNSAISHLCYGRNNKVDLVELCGGAGRISQVAFRRGLVSGGNLDLVTGVDLGDPQVQKAFTHYLETCYVLVVVLQPHCRSVGSFSSYNYQMNYYTWKQHFDEDLPHLQYCGKVALKQMRLGRYFLREQPAGSKLDGVEPWPAVQDHESVKTVLMDQCMAGAKDEQGYPVRKITEWTSNSEILLKPFAKCVCDNSHIHGTPTGKALEKMKLYSWKLCGIVVDGIQAIKQAVKSQAVLTACQSTSSYPVTSTGTEPSDEPPVRVPHKGLGCPACNNSLRRDSPQHTRNPKTCRQSHVKPQYWSCPACVDDKGRNPRLSDPGHTFQAGECRFVGRGPKPREGAHPREPRATATTHPSSEASGYDATQAEQVSGNGDVPSDEPAKRGPDSYQRTKRTYSSTGSGVARLPDWSRFDIQISLRNLRSYEPAVITRELRKLHLRWWHAREPKMRTLLQAAGLDEARLAMIKPIIDTCRECRAWQKRGNVVMPSVEITTKFNQAGECDLMFYKRSIAFHIIDRAIRLSGGSHVTDKTTETLLTAYATTWVHWNGPFELLYSDGELGLNNADAIAELKRLGTQLRVRAPGQHARIIESRNSMLRHVMHMIEEDLKRHGHSIPFPRLLAEAIFVVNAFTFYNGTSPYNAYTGRQPACLPDLENADFPKEGESSDGLREQRIREAGIEAITQSTAVAKINRALKTSTTVDGSRLFKVGDLMDYHRTTTTKDEHGGWNGPYPVVRNEPDRGMVICAQGNREINVRYPDARLTLFVEAIWTMEHGHDNDAMELILNHITRMQAGKRPETFGYEFTGKPARFQLTGATRLAPKVYMALQYIVRNYFRISDVIAIRLGKSIHSVNAYAPANRSVLVHYTSDTDPDFHYYESEDTALNIRDITGNPKARIIQCLVRDGCQSAMDDNADIAQEMMQETLPPHVQQGRSSSSSEHSGPPTPVNIDIGGNLPTIHETSETDSVDLIMESFYAELMN